MEIPPLCKTLFFTPSCEEVYSDDNRRIVAKHDIPENSLILLEHSLSLPIELMHAAIKHDPAAFDTLCPRVCKWRDQEDKHSAEFNQQIRNKIFQNVIGKTDELCSLGLAFSAINHADVSNCAVSTLRLNDHPLKSDIAIVFVFVVSKRFIPKDTEITISYSHDDSASQSFIQGISEDTLQRELSLEQNALQNCKLQTRAIDQYLRKKTWVQMCCRHKLMSSGIFIGNDFLLVITDQCMQKYPEATRQYLRESLKHESEKATGKPYDLGDKHAEIEAIFRYEWSETEKAFNSHVFENL